MIAIRPTAKSYSIEKTEKQRDAIRLMGQYMTVLLEGGGRSGKTFVSLYAIVLRALKHPGSRHMVARFRFNHAKQAICYDTMPAVLKALGIKSRVKLNKTDWFYEFPNGSQIWIGGLDDKDRAEKILGNEYATIFLNEASQISFDVYEMILTRLNPPAGCRPLLIIDYNPPSITHWGYLIFHKRQFPDGRPVPDDDFVKLRMNPKDNLKNISSHYLDTLSRLSESKRRRFMEGEYSLDSGKLWRRAWITFYPSPHDLPDFLRVVVGVDPSGSVEGDEIGIIIAGQYVDDHGRMKIMVLDDYSMHGSPNEWAAEVAAGYDRYLSDVVAAEKNYGGDMVEAVITGAKKNINVKLINSSRGKVVRAEPISAMYERGEVVHRMPFMNLEDEMCTYDPEISESPNRMDALVFALTELSGDGVSSFDIV
jgi:phage terminase large subunit-like protein